MQAPPRLTAHLVKIEQAARDVSLGQIGMDDFRDILDELEALFSTKLSEVDELQIPDEFATEVSPELDIGRRGIVRYLEAIADLRAYVKERNLASLQDGLEKAREANDLVNEALQMNWSTYQTYRQAAEEFIAQQKI